ncbi:glyoxalase [Mycolicibacterium wolinskyi]|uniref:Glyoxalase n=1 Tax=Mycolicibacterium wolinskyi TaxID=59750 RepID=A0A1X2FH41_9MYCO|nr:MULTISPECIES: glyoxalase [Mycolicibacterium]MCV7285286.1 glyoxalase [Mycolicibacterium wolinskyi]MCV7295211.1 glyoxalase [Mycolicibacterium goodii]ORX17770.1 glyoxalase [Mycolicibacterium wolinskyi]
MSRIEHVTIETPDPAATDAFHKAAFGRDLPVRTRQSDAPTSGFCGFTLSLVVPQPSTVDAFVGAALEAGATELKPPKKSFWGYGGVIASPDGTIWTVAASSKKNRGPETRQIDEFVLQLGVADVGASKQFYVERGLEVAKSYGSKYVQFAGPPITLALFGRRNLAKTAGVSPDGSGSHRIVVAGRAGPFTDPDGFAWETP